MKKGLTCFKTSKPFLFLTIAMGFKPIAIKTITIIIFAL